MTTRPHRRARAVLFTTALLSGALVSSAALPTAPALASPGSAFLDQPDSTPGPVDADENPRSLEVTQTAKGNTTSTDKVTVTIAQETTLVAVTSPLNSQLVAGRVTTTGTGHESATVRVLGANSTVVGTTEVENGTWSITDTNDLLPFGTYAYRVTQTDAKGGTTDALASIDHVPGDYAAPSVKSPPDGDVVYTARPTLAGTATPNATIRITEADSGTNIGTSRADTTGRWSAALSDDLAIGANSLRVSAIVNPGGHTDLIQHRVIREQMSEPAVIDPVDNALVVGRITTTGTGHEGATIQVFGSNGTVVGTAVVENNTWSIVDAYDLLPLGSYAYRVAQNAHGQERTTLASVDHVPADYVAATVTSPASGTTVAEPKPTFGGSATPRATIRLTDSSGTIIAQTTASAEGRWSAVAIQSLSNGENALTLTQVVNPGGHRDQTDYAISVAGGGSS